MPDTELETSTWIKLTLIAERARREPQCQFTSLAHLLDEGFLADCCHRLGKDRASGVDGVTWQEYGAHLTENLRDLVARMKAKRYRPQPAKRVYIPKDERSQRPLGLPALEDKIVQVGIALILEAIYEADFLDCSYGFRPGRGCHQALNAVDKTILTQPINHVIDADIKGFFDNVSHAWLEKCLRVRIKDPSFLLLIRRFLKAGYVEMGQFVATEQGTPQGGNLSPMLSNVFLHYVLDLWFEKRLKRQVRGACFLVRYADDFVVLLQYPDGAQLRLTVRRIFRGGSPANQSSRESFVAVPDNSVTLPQMGLSATDQSSTWGSCRTRLVTRTGSHRSRFGLGQCKGTPQLACDRVLFRRAEWLLLLDQLP